MYIIIGVCVILVIGFCAFLILNKKEVVLSDAEKFKQEFESYNGANYSGGYDGELIEVSIPKDNPFVYKTPKEIVDIMHNEDCYVLFGYATDPVTRKSIEVLLDALNERNIDTVYYVDIKDTKGRAKLNKIHEIFKNKFHGKSPFISFQHIRSHESQFIQLADFFIGAVTYKARGLHLLETGSQAKKELINYLEMKSGYLLDEGTEPGEIKFNIFDHQPRKRNGNKG